MFPRRLFAPAQRFGNLAGIPVPPRVRSRRSTATVFESTLRSSLDPGVFLCHVLINSAIAFRPKPETKHLQKYRHACSSSCIHTTIALDSCVGNAQPIYIISCAQILCLLLRPVGEEEEEDTVHVGVAAPRAGVVRSRVAAGISDYATLNRYMGMSMSWSACIYRGPRTAGHMAFRRSLERL